MSTYGVDEDWGRLTPSQMLAAGRTFAVGYVSEDTTGKNITAAEVQAYLAAGISVLLVYEYSTTAIAGGATRGTRDAGIAITHARALEYPRGCAVAFAVDQATSSNPSAVDAYCRAFTAAVHAAGYRSMVYGSYSTVKYCLDRGIVDLAWQTYAWSFGQWDSRAAIRQVNNAVTIAGKAVDLDTAQVADFGAWTPAGGTMLKDDPDGQWMFPRIQAIAQIAPPLSGPEKGQDLPVLKWMRDVQVNAAKAAAAAGQPAPVALTADQLAAIVAQVTAQLGAKLDAILAKLAAAGHALEP